MDAFTGMSDGYTVGGSFGIGPVGVGGSYSSSWNDSGLDQVATLMLDQPRYRSLGLLRATRKLTFPTAVLEVNKMPFQSSAIPIAISSLIATLIIRALITGCASASGDGIRRMKIRFFWLIIFTSFLALIFLIWKALSGS
jgi:hypothetical protein